MRNKGQRKPRHRVIRLGLLLVGMTLTILGWVLDWRGYVQGVGGGMCVMLTVSSGFAVARLLKTNATGEAALPAKETP